MQQIPNVSAADLQKLDEKIATSGTKGNKIDKAKRDLFKKLTGQVRLLNWQNGCREYIVILFQLVGKSVGQLFRKEIVIENLPPIIRNPNRHSIANLLSNGQSEDAGLTAMFAPPNKGS